MQIYLPIAGMPLPLLPLLGLGLAVGFLSGMFGVGGGFILTPILMFMGVPPIVAVGTGAAIVIASSVSGAIAHWGRGNVDIGMGGILTAAGLVGSTLGSQLQAFLKQLGQLELFTSLTYAAILTVIGSIMVTEGFWAWHRLAHPAALPAGTLRKRARSFNQKLPLRMRFRRAKMYISVLPPLAVGGFVGFLTAIMGAGGGFILIPLLVYVLGVNTRVAVGTSSLQVLCVASFTTVIQSEFNQNVDLMLGFPLMVGSVIAAQLGVRFGGQLKPETLRILLGLLVLLVGLRMVSDLVMTPADLYSLSSERLHR
ncbi:MAG: sulfite exporter TauE/SafE family protein [Alphaproteobacteria bacterium]|nr:sulfite exporter TauE/SafE family protein [Alphaproteobacteria bacterium]